MSCIHELIGLKDPMLGNLTRPRSCHTHTQTNSHAHVQVCTHIIGSFKYVEILDPHLTEENIIPRIFGL